MNDKHDVVIPLGVKSFDNNNFEIKVAVASIKKYFKCLNKIIIVTQIDPIKELGDDIIWVYQDDIYKHDKDANIIEKVRTAIEKVSDLTDDFIMWSDDQFITKDTEWKDTTPRYMMDQLSPGFLVWQEQEFGIRDFLNVLKDFQEKELVVDSSILISQVHSINRSSLRCAINSHIKQNAA